MLSAEVNASILCLSTSKLYKSAHSIVIYKRLKIELMSPVSSLACVLMVREVDSPDAAPHWPAGCLHLDKMK